MNIKGDTLPLGAVLHGKSYSYRIEQVLGQGSFGITYLASVKMQGALGSIDAQVKVAVKEFFMKEINGREGTTVTSGSKGGLFADYRKKFVREATNLSRLRHPHIIQVLECFEENNTVYYAMEYLDGGSLDDLIARRHGLPEAEALGYVRQVADALAYMHAHNVLHLDLKPGNVMLHQGKAVLIDFGLSKQYDEDGNPDSSTTVGGGTPGYAPIEQANYRDGKGFPVTMDIYALGGTLYKMLTGQRPPEASEVLNEGLPPKPAQISATTWAAVEAAMQPLRKNRPQTVEAWMALLPAAGQEEEAVAAKPTEDTILPEEVVMPPQPASRPEPHPQPAPTPRLEPKPQSIHKPVSRRKFLYALPVILIALVVGFVKIVAPKPEPEPTPVKLTQTGTINGYGYVDLGLSVKWATTNVGASSPSDYGYYFAWGETSPKSEYTEANSRTYGKNMGDIAGNAAYDAARAQWGSPWRLPTKAECKELLDQCTWTWTTTQDGHNGYLVKGKNGNSIFLPAAGDRYGSSLDVVGELGYYWSSSPYGINTEDAYGLCFGSSYPNVDWNDRDNGRSVRPVSE
ncbi:MAG: protein kinase [Bacteroidaceae bacterium]